MPSGNEGAERVIDDHGLPLDPVAGVLVRDGDGEEAEAGGYQDHIEHVSTFQFEIGSKWHPSWVAPWPNYVRQIKLAVRWRNSLRCPEKYCRQHG